MINKLELDEETSPEVSISIPKITNNSNIGNPTKTQARPLLLSLHNKLRTYVQKVI